MRRRCSDRRCWASPRYAACVDAAEAYELSRLDEAFQQSQWGEDAEAAARTAAGRRDARLIGDWFTGLRS